MADLGVGKGGGFVKSGLFLDSVAFSPAVMRSGGAPLAPPAGSGAEPQLQVRGMEERFELPQRGLGRCPSRQRILVYFRTNFMHFRAI